MCVHHPDVAVIYPQDQVLRIGSTLMATCTLSPELGLHANKLYWTMNGMRLSSSTYDMVSPDTLSVTLHHLNGSQQKSGDNLVCHGADGLVLGGSCLYVGSKLRLLFELYWAEEGDNIINEIINTECVFKNYI